jgi:hypothetical protein
MSIFLAFTTLMFLFFWLGSNATVDRREVQIEALQQRIKGLERRLQWYGDDDTRKPGMHMVDQRHAR